MKVAERTRQQLDPAASAGIAIVTFALCCGAFCYAVVMTLRSLGQISNPVISFVGLAILAIGCIFVLIATEPLRSPVTRSAHAFALSVVILAAITEAVSRLGSNTYVQDDWGPIAIGFVLVALSPYRPAGEIAWGGVIAAGCVGLITFIEADGFVSRGPAVAFVVVAMTPVIAFTAAGAVFSHTLMTAIERWQRRARDESLSLEREFREGIARSVQQDRVTILSRDVLPFFTQVLATRTLDDDDRARAREIADSIRRVMVQEVDRSWLDNVLEIAASVGTRGSGSSRIVCEDPSNVAALMTTDQRTAIRALLVAILDVRPTERKNLTIILSRDDTFCHARISAELDLNDYVMRSTFAPYFAVMRAVFTELEVQFLHPNLTLRFSYEHL